MKRELKLHSGGVCPTICIIAEPIPMKRELKRVSTRFGEITNDIYCRAYPDEKGIETGSNSMRG